MKSIVIGISFPRELIEKIDIERGDISRSRFIWKILEKTIDAKVDALPNQKNRVTGGFEANRSQQLTEQSKSQGSEPIEND